MLDGSTIHPSVSFLDGLTGGPARAGAAGGVRGEARELGAGPGGGQGRGGLLTSTADAVRRRSRVGADRRPGGG
jgi:hypothetical protein